ncbi:MAG: RHS repeat-associated core domain-containing protein, partial [Mariprofundaceae bacterium]
NTRFVSNDAGAVQASYAYSPFGVLQSKTGVLDNPFTWQGQGGLFDDGNGLYYARARYYDANSGRFVSKDATKSSAPKRINPYQYALNDPLLFVDVRGTEPSAAILKKLNNKFGVKKITRTMDKPFIPTDTSNGLVIDFRRGTPRSQLIAVLLNIFGKDLATFAFGEEEDPLASMGSDSIDGEDDIDIWDTDEGDIPEPVDEVAKFIDSVGGLRPDYKINFESSARDAVVKFDLPDPVELDDTVTLSDGTVLPGSASEAKRKQKLKRELARFGIRKK